MTQINKLARYFHTLRYLKLKQIYYRIKYFKQKKISITLLANIKTRAITKSWNSIIQSRNKWHSNNFTALNHTVNAQEAIIWNDKTQSKLWLYQLHYMEGAHKELMLRWIKENPPTSGIGWEPYPISLRLVNWIKIFYQTPMNFQFLKNTSAKLEELSNYEQANNQDDRQDIEATSIEEKIILKSMSLQAQVLMQRLEYHILGNHLFENAKALLFVGLFFNDANASKWYQKGFDILQHEIKEQFLEDGAHFELSPMYHAIMLHGLLDIIQIHHIYEKKYPVEWQTLASKMLHWLQQMTHADGDFAFFNDTCLEEAPTTQELVNYAQQLSIVPVDSEKNSSGYYRLAINNAVVIADCAAIGPNYLPGHAHADSLSFEMSLGTERIFVNSGISTYAMGALRDYQRSTAAHNTIEIEGQNSSQTWASFRVAKRAKTKVLTYTTTPHLQEVWAEHDGYKHLSCRAMHQRSWTLKDHQLVISDTLTTKKPCSCKIFFHLHPDISVSIVSKNVIALESKTNKKISMEFPLNMKISLLDTAYYPKFGNHYNKKTLMLEVLCAEQRQNYTYKISW